MQNCFPETRFSHKPWTNWCIRQCLWRVKRCLQSPRCKESDGVLRDFTCFPLTANRLWRFLRYIPQASSSGVLLEPSAFHHLSSCITVHRPVISSNAQISKLLVRRSIVRATKVVRQLEQKTSEGHWTRRSSMESFPPFYFCPFWCIFTLIPLARPGSRPRPIMSCQSSFLVCPHGLADVFHCIWSCPSSQISNLLGLV